MPKYGLRATASRRSIRREEGKTDHAMSMMYLDENGKPVKEDEVTSKHAWNFTGKPIEEVIEKRQKVS